MKKNENGCLTVITPDRDALRVSKNNPAFLYFRNEMTSAKDSRVALFGFSAFLYTKNNQIVPHD
jgi:hypothetical protein